jgi:hypothetical protein
MEVMFPSWTQYLLQQNRMTKADREVMEEAESLHVGTDPPEVRMYLGVNREVLSHKGQRKVLTKTPTFGSSEQSAKPG